VVITKCSQAGVLALAYDDGPYQYTSTLVDILDKAGAKGTFFWTGTLYGCIYNQKAAVQKAYASGHQIASHTWYDLLPAKRQLVGCSDLANTNPGHILTWEA
jgi:peptidoglycan/xylan/chitin deacetylase (PgdA/CDA1 family)